MNIDLEQQKSKLLFRIKDESKKVKLMAARLQKDGKKNLPTEEYGELKKQIESINHGVKSILKESRKMHFKGATSELIKYLEDVLGSVKSERQGLESIMQGLRVTS